MLCLWLRSEIGWIKVKLVACFFCVLRLPEGFSQLCNITHLYLNDTQLTELPRDIGQLAALVVLELRENALQSLPDSVANLQRLRSLDLGANEFDTLVRISFLPFLHFVHFIVAYSLSKTLFSCFCFFPSDSWKFPEFHCSSKLCLLEKFKIFTLQIVWKILQLKLPDLFKFSSFKVCRLFSWKIYTFGFEDQIGSRF